MLRERSIGMVAGSGSKGYGDREMRGELELGGMGTRYWWE